MSGPDDRGEDVGREIRFWSKGPHYSRWLSAFDISPFHDGLVTYRSLEHYYQSHRCVYTADFLQIIRYEWPYEAKRLGSKVETRKNWHQINVDVMLDGMRLMYDQLPTKRKLLLETEDRPLIHFAPWGDTFWGVDKEGQGQNMQGKLHMRVRDELQKRSVE